MTWRDRCLMVIALWNGMVFLTYGLDKRKAIQNRWRIPEKVLLLESWLLSNPSMDFLTRRYMEKDDEWKIYL